MIKSFFNKNNSLIKASYYNVIIVIVKVISGVITSNVLAKVGPSGFAIIGNFRNFIEGASSFTAEGYQNGTIRYISENQNNSVKQKQLLATVFQLSLSFSIIVGLVLFLFCDFWSQMVFHHQEYNSIIKITGIGLPFLSFNLLLIYIFNGFEKYKKLAILNSILSLGNMVVTVLLTIEFGLEGALYGIILGPFFVFLIFLIVLGEQRNILLHLFKFQYFKFNVVRNLSSYLFMALYSVLIVSSSFLIIRNFIIEKLGADQAGYWEAMNKISSFYLMFFVSLTTFYLLPKFSKSNLFSEFIEECKRFYSLIIPVVVFGFIVIYFLRFFVLDIVLNKDFYPTEELFLWKLIGDFFNILSLVLIKKILSKKNVIAYLVSNGMLNLMFVIFSYFFLDIFGLEGVLKAQALSYFLYLWIVVFFLRIYFKKQNNSFG
ncbi:O-antigen translocase [Mesonia sp. K7]|uniref:O-antigen translocase n=1 Tax=Mesonia sp. K7 TaxID=2218606 RepID=UPI000DA99486|nr:O-antigen translocase [Mesonia sp. K7]PZD78049.1 hypothetical protein DNG35_06655 [Mesonia sp. K7]